MGMNNLSPQDNIAAQNRITSELREQQAGDDLTRSDSYENAYKKFGTGEVSLKIRTLEYDNEVKALENMDPNSQEYFDKLLGSF